MKSKVGLGLLVGAVSLATGQAWAQGSSPSNDELWQIIQRQQAEIEKLKGDVESTDQKVEATADAVEAAGSASASATSLGGYAELHYNNLELNGENNKDQIDLHRFVIFMNHQFSDSVRLFTELEVEHSLAGDGKPGEVEIEQAFIEVDVAAAHRAKVGLFLLPIGILNETHEPNTFYGVERNAIENKIIPTTWWEGGFGMSGELAPGVGYDIALHSGLDAAGGSIRSGRQKVAEAKADQLAVTGRLKYTGIPGLELAASLQHQDDILQGENVAGITGVEADLLEAHVVYQSGGFGIKALMAQWDIDSAINAIRPGAEEQSGWYIEPSYRIGDIGFFIRASQWDEQGADAANSEYDQLDFGINYWLTEGVVLKADIQKVDEPDGDEVEGFNLGVGWAF